MDVTLLYFDDCPNWLVTNDYLEALLPEHPELSITRHIVDTPEEAERTGFRGSPSILVDGVDPFADPHDPIGLSCRIYQTPDGPAGSPTLDQLRHAVALSLPTATMHTWCALDAVGIPAALGLPAAADADG